MIEDKDRQKDRSILYPLNTLEGCSNYKRYFVIDRDGSTTERVLLNILDKRTREHVICIHFLQFLAEHFIGTAIGFNILSRDEPWDFRLGLSTGIEFNLEIVSIADNRLKFETLSREEIRDATAYDSQVRLRDLKKIAHQFSDKSLAEAVSYNLACGTGLDELVDNPDYGNEQRIYVGKSEPLEDSLAHIIDEAISSKEAKSHAGKEETILVIDNRTSVYFVEEVKEAFSQLADRLDKSPFKEVWFYHGYCSDEDGNNGQYTIIGGKVASETGGCLSRAFTSVASLFAGRKRPKAIYNTEE